MNTSRECNRCKYRTVIVNDNLEERECKHCGGLLKIISNLNEKQFLNYKGNIQL